MDKRVTSSSDKHNTNLIHRSQHIKNIERSRMAAKLCHRPDGGPIALPLAVSRTCISAVTRKTHVLIMYHTYACTYTRTCCRCAGRCHVGLQRPLWLPPSIDGTGTVVQLAGHELALQVQAATVLVHQHNVDELPRIIWILVASRHIYIYVHVCIRLLKCIHSVRTMNVKSSHIERMREKQFVSIRIVMCGGCTRVEVHLGSVRIVPTRFEGGQERTRRFAHKCESSLCPAPRCA